MKHVKTFENINEESNGELDRLEKAKEQLENIDIYTKIDNGTLYVQVGDTLLELADYEIDYRAKLYDEEN